MLAYNTFMKLVLSHETALQLLRSNRELGHERIEPSRIRTLNDCARSLQDVETFALPFLTDNAKAIHILIPRTSSKYSSKTHVCHTMSGEIPRGSFCRVGDGVYAPSPELLLVQMANGKMSPVEIALLGLELCGTYTLLASGNFGFYNCPAITSREQIEAFAKRAAHIRGSAAVLQGLRWVVDGSNSPMESALMLYLCLPVRLGGYGFPLPSLNPEKPLSAKATQMLQQETIRCDLHWVKEHVVVEYDSSQEHLNAATSVRDSKRRNTLGYEKTQVITVTPSMIARPAEFDSVARQLARALHKRMRPDAFVLSQARSELRMKLFPWLRHLPDFQLF